MTLKFTNEQIYFALESIWSNLQDYKFKTHINSLVVANDADDYEQDVTVSVPTLTQCYIAISSGNYGAVTDMAEELLPSLKTQLYTASNLTEFETYMALADKTGVPIVEPNEYTLALIEIGNLKARDVSVRDAKVLNGKTQILA